MSGGGFVGDDVDGTVVGKDDDGTAVGRTCVGEKVLVGAADGVTEGLLVGVVVGIDVGASMSDVSPTTASAVRFPDASDPSRSSDCNIVEFEFAADSARAAESPPPVMALVKLPSILFLSSSSDIPVPAEFVSTAKVMVKGS